MPEMQETTSTSDTIYSDIEREPDPAALQTMTASTDNTNRADSERLQQNPNHTSANDTTQQQQSESPTAGQLAAAHKRPTKLSANDFRFGKSIGEGSFSTVYLAKDIHTNKEYASKWRILIVFVIFNITYHFHANEFETVEWIEDTLISCIAAIYTSAGVRAYAIRGDNPISPCTVALSDYMEY